MVQHNPSPGPAPPAPGWEGLAEAIIELAIQDIKVPREMLRTGPYDSIEKRKRQQRKNRKDALRFFKSQWFEGICEVAGADPDVLRRAIAQYGEERAK